MKKILSIGLTLVLIFSFLNNATASASYAATKLTAPTITAPKNGNTFTDDVNIKIVWKSVKGAIKYEVLLYDKSINKILINKSQTQTSYTIKRKSTEESMQYQFRVRAIGKTSKSNYSTVSFAVLIPEYELEKDPTDSAEPFEEQPKLPEVTSPASTSTSPTATTPTAASSPEKPATSAVKEPIVIGDQTDYGKYLNASYSIFDDKSGYWTTPTANLYIDNWNKNSLFIVNGNSISSREARGVSFAGNRMYNYSDKSYAAVYTQIDNKKFDYKELTWLLEYDDKNIGSAYFIIVAKNTAGTTKLLTSAEYSEVKLDNGLRKITVNTADYTNLTFGIVPNFKDGALKSIYLDDNATISIGRSSSPITIESNLVIMGPYGK